MSGLKWNWVYRPYLDAPEKQKESALRAGYAKVVFKSDADEVIARLEAENEQLKAENSRLKYRRCLAMANVEWLKKMILCDHPESILYRRADRRERKWKEMATQCKK